MCTVWKEGMNEGRKWFAPCWRSIQIAAGYNWNKSQQTQHCRTEVPARIKTRCIRTAMCVLCSTGQTVRRISNAIRANTKHPPHTNNSHNKNSEGYYKWQKRRRYSDSLQAGRSGDRIPVEARLSATVQTSLGTHLASYTVGTGSFTRVKRPGRGVDHPLHLAPMLKKE
jgi:hypothetical protein